MKKTTSLLAAPGKALASRASQAVLDQLPVDQKKLRRAAALLEPKNLKRLGVIAVGGGAVLSLTGTLAQARLTRSLVARELRRQLAPISKQLDALEAQNKELREQNEKLAQALEKG